MEIEKILVKKLTKCDNDDCIKIDSTEYQSLVGSLMYLAISTRPAIMHSVSKLSQFNKSPHIEHFVAAKRLRRYLKATMNSKLSYTKTSKPIYTYVNVDWAGDTDDRRSYTGFAFFIANGCVSWESKKQPSVALSSTEAEYMALSQSSNEAIYFHNFLIINSDNIGAQQLAKNPVFHARSKHIEIRHHFVREVYQKAIIDLNYVATDEMIADILTKNLFKPKHSKFFGLLGLK